MIKEGWKGDGAKEGWRHLLSNLDFGNLEKILQPFSAFDSFSVRGDINYCLEFDEIIIERTHFPSFSPGNFRKFSVK